MTKRSSLEDLLRTSGYEERSDNVFESVRGRRVICLVDCAVDIRAWSTAVTGALSKPTMRAAQPWSRYVVLLVKANRTRDLARSAAAITRDVAKCRRIVAFADQNEEESIPFLGLKALPQQGGIEARDVSALVSSGAGDAKLSEAILDVRIPLAQLYRIAETPETANE